MKKKLNFSYDLTALDAFSLERADEMLLNAVLGSVTPRYAKLYPGMKGTSMKIGVMANDPTWQNGLTCGLAESGSTDITQVEIVGCYKTARLNNCGNELRDYFLSQALSNSLYQENIPFEELFIQDLGNRAADFMEVELWQGTQCGINGIGDLIVAGGTDGGAYTALTVNNAVDVLNAVVLQLPAKVQRRTDLTIFLSFADYRAFIASLAKTSSMNLFTLGDESGLSTETTVFLPGSNIAVVPTQGLDGTSTIFCGPSQDILIGLAADDGMAVRVQYDFFNDTVASITKVGFGVGVHEVSNFVFID
jgi:hypothetical protein